MFKYNIVPNAILPNGATVLKFNTVTNKVLAVTDSTVQPFVIWSVFTHDDNTVYCECGHYYGRDDLMIAVTDFDLG